MLTSIVGKKIGMTQLFDDAGNVVPVTVVDVGNLFITQIKTKEKDGYIALQLGLLRDRFKGKTFVLDWLKKKSDHFVHIKEISLEMPIADITLGQAFSLDLFGLQAGALVSATGWSKGLGFQGVVRRWNFGGGPAAHGSKFHRRPGAISHMRTQGEVIKGKKFPGHLGCERTTTKGLRIVRIDKENGCVFVKGAIPGKANSLVMIKKQEK